MYVADAEDLTGNINANAPRFIVVFRPHRLDGVRDVSCPKTRGGPLPGWCKMRPENAIWMTAATLSQDQMERFLALIINSRDSLFLSILASSLETNY